MLAAIDTKHNIQSTISPDAPLNSSPKPLNSIVSAFCLNIAITMKDAIKANGSPIIAAKFFTTKSVKTGSNRFFQAAIIKNAAAPRPKIATAIPIICRHSISLRSTNDRRAYQAPQCCQHAALKFQTEPLPLASIANHRCQSQHNEGQQPGNGRHRAQIRFHRSLGPKSRSAQATGSPGAPARPRSRR